MLKNEVHVELHWDRLKLLVIWIRAVNVGLRVTRLGD